MPHCARISPVRSPRPMGDCYECRHAFARIQRRWSFIERMCSNRKAHPERGSRAAASALARSRAGLKAQAHLAAFLRDVERIKVHDEDDSAFENELEDYRNDASDG